jgi:hypothetical protein
MTLNRAILLGKCCELAVRALVYGSKEQRPTEIEGWFGPDMLDPATAFRAESVEAQTVGRGVDLADQAGAQRHPLRGIHLALENRFLDALAEIEAGARHAPRAASVGGRPASPC